MHDETRDELGPEPGKNSESPSSATPPIAPSVAAQRPKPPRAWVGPALIGANVAVFVAMALSGVSAEESTTEQIVAWGADFGPRVADGEWWRLITCAFVHFGLLHVGMNMLALRSLRVVERLFGSGRFAFIYFVSAVGASVTSVLYRPVGLSAGASGAICGLLGALLAALLIRRRFLPPNVARPMIQSILFTIAINVVISLMVPVIDNAAHLGGFVVGFAAAACLKREIVAPDPSAPGVFVAIPSRKPLVRSLLLVIAIAIAAAFIPARVRSDTSGQARFLLGEADEALRAKDYAKAKSISDRVIEKYPDQAVAYSIRAESRWRFATSKEDRAAVLRDLDRAIELDAKSTHALHLRWQFRRNRGDVDGEIADLDRLVELEPDNPGVQLERAHASFAAGRWKEALNDFRRVAELGQEDAGEAQLYIWLVTARTGDRSRADAELKSYLTSFSGSSMSPSWRRIALAIIGEGESLKQLSTRDEGKPGATCRVLFFLASKELMDGAKAAAAADFERCIRECDGSTPERWSAAAELERLRR